MGLDYKPVAKALFALSVTETPCAETHSCKATPISEMLRHFIGLASRFLQSRTFISSSSVCFDMDHVRSAERGVVFEIASCGFRGLPETLEFTVF